MKADILAYKQASDLTSSFLKAKQKPLPTPPPHACFYHGGEMKAEL
jgi:hypothetical protein